MAEKLGTEAKELNMSNATDRTMTAEQLAALPDDGKRYELVEGVLHMMSPAGNRHGRIAAKLLRRIGVFVEQHKLGETYAAETGFLIQQSPDTVRAADVSFVVRDRLLGFADQVGFLPIAPDLLAEVVSPNDRTSEVEAKARAWLGAGARIVLIVDPQTATVRVCRPASSVQVHSDGFVDLNDVLPGFQLDVAELFA
jgi:Uma2 family endonuclease